MLSQVKPHILEVLGTFEARAVTILIDGASGAGKTTLAEEVQNFWPEHRNVVVIHLDDFYPGWSGLDAASDQVANSFLPARVDGADFQYRVWDWVAGEYSEQRTVSARDDLIIEGCGALSRQAAERADLSIWIDADDSIRKQRALSRGNEDFEEHWDEWDRQFTAFVRRENPQRSASVSVGAKR